MYVIHLAFGILTPNACMVASAINKNIFSGSFKGRTIVANCKHYFFAMAMQLFSEKTARNEL